jgi:hypothetical protein
MTDRDDALLDDDTADVLLAELGRALADEITDAHHEAAISAFWIARTDALIAEVEEHLDAGQRAGVRGDVREREHVYRLDDLSVSLVVDSVDRRVMGRIVGPNVGARWLDSSGASRPIELDVSGRFRMSSPPRGPASVEVALEDGRRVRTAWTLL